MINGHQDGGAFFVLLDGATCKEKWRYKPETDLRAFSTPVIATIEGNRQIVLTGAKQTVGLEPESGERLWWVDGPTEKFVCTPTPLLLGQYLHIMNDAGIYSCVEPVSGDVLKTLRKGGNTYNSPVGIGDRVYFFDDTGLCPVRPQRTPPLEERATCSNKYACD